MFDMNIKPLHLLLLTFLLSIVLFLYQSSRSIQAITTIGIGTKQVVPEKTTITFAYVLTASDQRGALASGENGFNQILSDIGRFNPSQVNKNVAQVAPQYLPDGSGISSFQYANGAQIELNGTENVQDVIRSLNDRGAIVAQVSYKPQNETEIDAEVRALAVKNAQEKAQHMAKAAGARVGRVLSITEQGSTGESGTSVTRETTSEMATAGSNIEVQSAVSATFSLKPWWWLL